MGGGGTSIAPDRARLMVTVSRFMAGTLLLLGILGLLRTAGEEGTASLTVFTVHPLTALIWTVLGLVGVAMSTKIARTQHYLVGAGGILVVWAVLCLLLDGSPSDLFVRDTELIAFNGILGLLALVAALTQAPARLIGTTE
jgi:hypothetical protein